MIKDLSKDLPTGWAWTTLGEVRTDRSQSIDPRRFPHEAFDLYSVPSYEVGNPEVVTGQDVGSSKQTVEPRTVLLCKINPRINRVWVVSDRTDRRQIASTEWIAFFPVRSIFPAYLQYYMMRNHFRDYLAGNASGVGGSLMRIKATTFASYPLPLAPFPEQQRIVAAIEEQFTRLDAAVAGLKRTQANLKRYRAAVLAAACSGRLVPTEAQLARQEGRDYEPADRLLQRILTERRERWEADHLAKMQARGKVPKGDAWKSGYAEPVEPDAEDVIDVPEGWCVASVDALTSHITSGSRDWTKYYHRGTGTFLMAQNVRPGFLDLSFRQAVDPPENDRDRARSQVVEGDVLVTIVGANTGDVCRVPHTLPEHYVCQSVALMRPVVTDVSPYLTTYLISDEHGQRQYRRYIYGQGRPHLSFDQLRMTSILLPPLAEQSRIEEEVERHLSVIQQLETTVEHALTRADRLRQSILRRAFKGTLVPQDPTDEPADVLLERIRADRAATAPNGRQRRTKARRSTQRPLFDLQEVGETE